MRWLSLTLCILASGLANVAQARLPSDPHLLPVSGLNEGAVISARFEQARGAISRLLLGRGDPASTFEEFPVPVMRDLASFPPPPRPDDLVERMMRNLPRTTAGQTPETCLQLAIYHEARGETEEGQKAVASVVLQRVDAQGRWGDSICEVVAPVMFSFVAADLSTPPIEEWEAWRAAGRVAHDMIEHGPLKSLKGADHYHTLDVTPSWSAKMTRIKTIGSHIFYADPSTRPAI